ncbi:uncharacterized protein K02A2.6-like [Drosophila grimshawi]|uniref:uncharacterized protein K02A2.6-like n=1 Tax=Drosophila grimshawi TaxID=7222 RepID=UPI001C931DB1|nr:uncharacterized protein K02A2.6-like [Drosophila grimshawi]
MAVQVREYVRECMVCKETKATNQRIQVSIGQEVKTERPFQKLYIDFLGKYPRSKRGHAWVFVVVDHFSKFTFLKAMKDATADNVVEFLINEVFFKFGVPETIHSDNGRQFVSKKFENMAEAFGISHMRTAIYSPSKQCSRARESNEIEVAIRNAVHSATGVTPFFTVFGQQMYLNGASYKLARKLRSMGEHSISDLETQDKIRIVQDQVRLHLHKAFERSRQQYDKRARKFHAVPGQEVYRRNFVLSDFSKAFNAKFAKKFRKCRIVRVVGNNAYEVEDLNGRSLGVVHAKDLRI